MQGSYITLITRLYVHFHTELGRKTPSQTSQSNALNQWCSVSWHYRPDEWFTAGPHARWDLTCQNWDHVGLAGTQMLGSGLRAPCCLCPTSHTGLDFGAPCCPHPALHHNHHPAPHVGIRLWGPMLFLPGLMCQDQALGLVKGACSCYFMRGRTAEPSQLY